MIYLKTNREILEYYARKDIHDRLRNPRCRMKYSQEQTVNTMLQVWQDTGEAQEIITNHRHKFAHLYSHK